MSYSRSSQRVDFEETLIINQRSQSVPCVGPFQHRRLFAASSWSGVMRNDDNRTGGVLDALLADRAKQEAGEASVASRPDNQKIVVVDSSDEHLGRRTIEEQAIDPVDLIVSCDLAYSLVKQFCGVLMNGANVNRDRRIESKELRRRLPVVVLDAALLHCMPNAAPPSRRLNRRSRQRQSRHSVDRPGKRLRCSPDACSCLFSFRE